MIRYALRCDKDHAFDGWFRSADGYEGQVAGGQLRCPDCGSRDVVKALMAPSVTAEAGPRVLTAPATPREAALAELRRKVEANSEYVGLNFAAEARAIHDGDAPERSIYGEARLDEARALIEDGVPVAPLPFLPAGKVN
jgi:hypothetical protein